LALLQIIWATDFCPPAGPTNLHASWREATSRVSVLDIGCGLGAVDELLVAQYDASGVVGIDIDPALLEGMRTRIERANLGTRIRGVKVEPGPLPFATASSTWSFRRTPCANPGQARDFLRNPAGSKAGRRFSRATGCAPALAIIHPK